jgi:asparagine synthase (glutamine-hydrolysing)
MSCSLEVRVPFLDYRVVELGLGVEAERLLRDGRTKAVVRDALAPLLPATVLERSAKQGFTVDGSSWLAGSLGREIADAFASDSMASRPWFRAEALSDALSAGSLDAVWRSFAVERWLRLFVDPQRVEAPRGASQLAA